MRNFRSAMTDAELAALRRIVDGLNNLAYAKVAKRPEDIYRAWYVTRFERDTVARILGDLIDEHDHHRRIEQATEYVNEAPQLVEEPQAKAMAYLKAMKGSG